MPLTIFRTAHTAAQPTPTLDAAPAHLQELIFAMSLAGRKVAREFGAKLVGDRRACRLDEAAAVFLVSSINAARPVLQVFPTSRLPGGLMPTYDLLDDGLQECARDMASAAIGVARLAGHRMLTNDQAGVFQEACAVYLAECLNSEALPLAA